MAFHVACPITCRRICHCSLGFPRSLRSAASKDEFLRDVSKLEEFLAGSWGIKARETSGTVQVEVPTVAPTPPPTTHPAALVDPFDGLDDTLAAVSAQAKRVALKKKAAAALVAAEFESGDLADQSGDLVEEHSKILCRMCLLGESEGSEMAKKMLSCKSCGKKYHRSCLKNWSLHRDLFHWSSWTCPSCRSCEICQRAGDPKKFTFCKRCDGAYHCYCQHPPHKNISSGAYLCPKHTSCHSCGSNVPGNGLSLRWFLGYTCCDACGRLFVKGNYCPVCLKVYRDSESKPMVCCDHCQHWVHTDCDGISDEKYLQFQVDGNLQYVCSACRGECYQVKDLEDAVQELWRRKDVADRDLIVSLRAAAGLPTREELFSISPYSDDEENAVVVKNESGRSLKLSFKGLSGKSAKKVKGLKKISSKKKLRKSVLLASCVLESDQSLQAQHNTRSSAGNLIDGKEDNVQLSRSREVDDATAGGEDKKSRVLHIKNSNPQNGDSEMDVGKLGSKSRTVNEKRLVIHLGARGRNSTNSPRSDASSCQKEHDLLASNVFRKRSTEETLASPEGGAAVPTFQTYRRGTLSSRKQMEHKTDANSQPPKDSRPPLKLKFKSLNRNSQPLPSPLPHHDEEKNPIKGQRSKRKRPSPIVSQASFDGDEHEDKLLDEIIMDANWILKKLGKDAIGKRVEVHQPSDNSWHKGVVADIVEVSSTLSVDLDDGRVKTVELGKHGIRFVSRKQKRS